MCDTLSCSITQFKPDYKDITLITFFFLYFTNFCKCSKSFNPLLFFKYIRNQGGGWFLPLSHTMIFFTSSLSVFIKLERAFLFNKAKQKP